MFNVGNLVFNSSMNVEKSVVEIAGLAVAIGSCTEVISPFVALFSEV